MPGNILKNKKFWFALLVFFNLLCVAYLPNSRHFGYLQDDWFTLFITENRGPENLIDHYAVDRPIRGYFTSAEYALFNTDFQAYNIVGLSFRYLDTLFVFLSLMIIWPKKWFFNLLICALLIVYPGFHEQPHALDYQTQFLARMTFSLSLFLGFLAYTTTKKWLSILLVILALLLSQICFNMMEYYVGMEAIRFALFLILFRNPGKKFLTWRNIAYSLVFLAGAALFSIWRVFFFTAERVSVNTTSMLAEYDNPLQAIAQNGIALARNLYRLVISAFYEPVLVFIQKLTPSEILIYFGAALLGMALLAGILYWGLKKLESVFQPKSMPHSLELIIAGIVGSIGALAPIVFGGREISYSILGDRFSFPGSISACILIIGLVSLINRKNLQLAAFSLLILSSLFTQLVNDDIFKKNYIQTNATWWQFSWRAPQLIPETLLSGMIELGMNDEDYTFWGPANLIYYPTEQEPYITSEILEPGTKDRFLAQEIEYYRRKAIQYKRNFKNILIITKDSDSCLHVIDGKHPEFSEPLPDYVREVSLLSNIDLVRAELPKTMTPRTDLFGPEPEKGWCYYYQLAQLERQRGNWDRVAEYGQIAIEEGFTPSDSMEWIVFIQGFAYHDSPLLEQAMAAAQADTYTQSQLCEVIASYTPDLAATPYSSQHLALKNLVCK